MRLWAKWLLLVSALGAALAIGCAYRRGNDDGCLVLPPMAIVGRGRLEPDPQTVPAPSGQEQPLLATPTSYHELSAAQVQCLAASNASLGDLVMRERELNEPRCPLVSIARIHRKQQERTRNCILEYSAQELQNQASALALKTFFQLAEAEAQADVALAASQSLGNVTLQVRQWKQQGLKLPADIDSVEKQWLDAQTKYAQLRGTIQELNAQLSELLSLPYDAEMPFWPQADLSIRNDPIDPDLAVQTGLTYRGDLNVLRCALSNLNENTLPETRELIKTVNGLLGDRKGKEFTRQVLAPLMQILGLSSRETQMRREQLARLLSNREQSAAEEIRLAVNKLELQLYIVDLARKELLQAQTRFSQVQEKEQKGLASILDRIQVEGEWYKARSAFIHEVMQWHVDMIKLKHAQGVLPVECAGSQFCQ